MTTCIFKILLCAWDMNYIKLFYWESLPIPVYSCIWTPGLALFEEIQEYDLLGGSMSLRLPSESLKPWANSSSFFLLCACRKKKVISQHSAPATVPVACWQPICHDRCYLQNHSPNKPFHELSRSWCCTTASEKKLSQWLVQQT